ncbi:MAG: hypothetical protein LBP35_04170 [Candidatus Ancillula trichonymphae]|nr:hypothetical protein [Candidatus Ancillula trichonymphae]
MYQIALKAVDAFSGTTLDSSVLRATSGDQPLDFAEQHAFTALSGSTIQLHADAMSGVISRLLERLTSRHLRAHFRARMTPQQLF